MLAPALAAASSFVAAPSAAQSLAPHLIRAQCETVHEIADQSILFGYVVESLTRTPLPGSTVHLAWVTLQGARDSTMHKASTETVDGAFIFCDVPQDTRLVAWAVALGQTSQIAEFFFEGGESTRHDLELIMRRATGGIAGTLLDATTGSPVQGATLTMDGQERSTLSDRNGRFRFGDVPLGNHRIRVEHIAYGRPELDIVVNPGLTTHLDVRLDPQPIAVEPIAVQVTLRRQWLESNGFYDRQSRSLGQFVTPEEIEQMPWRRFSEVLRDVPGINIRQICTPHCAQLIRMAGATQTACVPTFYMDGRRIHMREEMASRWEPRGMIDLDALAVTSDVAAVEVYRSIAETPPQFYGRCGSIVIWTKRGGA